MTPIRPEILIAFLHESNLIEGIETDLASYYYDDLDVHQYNSLEAAHHALQLAHDPLDLATVLELHNLQMSNLLDHKFCGKFRNCNGMVGGDICPPPKELKKLIASFLKKWEKKSLSCLDLHYEFETIHPFVDGNGRTGRLLYLMDKIRRGEIVRPILDEFEGSGFLRQRKAYYNAIRRYKLTLKFASLA